MEILRVENLSVRYEGVLAVSDISFSIKQGEYVCILGGNGAGKTTIVKALLGLVKYKGLVEWKLPRRQISYVPQVVAADRDFPATVFEVVLSGRLGQKGILGLYNRADKEAAQKALEQMGIANLKNHKIGELSGGQQQRAFLARALCSDAKVLIMDEPSAALDQNISGDFYAMLARLNRENQITPILITHSLDDAVRYADKIISVRTQLDFYGTAQQYLEQKGRVCRHEHGHEHDRHEAEAQR